MSTFQDPIRTVGSLPLKILAMSLVLKPFCLFEGLYFVIWMILLGFEGFIKFQALSFVV